MTEELDIDIREATPADAEAIAKVHVETWQSAYRGDIPDAILDGLSLADREMQWSQLLKDSKPRSNIYVAEVDGELVGFTSAGPCRDEDLMEFDVGEIYAIYVTPEHWREGIGSGLMRRTVEFLAQEDYDFMSLWVLKTNRKARDFYEKAGFVPDGTEKIDDRDAYQLEEVRYRAMLH